MTQMKKHCEAKVLHENNRTIIPTDLVTNSLLFSLCPFLQTKNKNQVFSKVGGLVTRNISVFVYSKSRSTSKPCQIQ